MGKYSIYNSEVEKEMQDIIERKVASNEYNFEGRRRRRIYREYIEKNEMVYSIVVAMGLFEIEHQVIYREPSEIYHKKQEEIIIRYKPIEARADFFPRQREEIEKEIIKQAKEEYVDKNWFSMNRYCLDSIIHGKQTVFFTIEKTLKNKIIVKITGAVDSESSRKQFEEDNPHLFKK
jgi:hypothetical protein